MKTVLYAAVGPRLDWYDVDVEAADLTPRGTFDLPEGLQYLWRHASQPFLYAACSDGRPGFKGTRHVACALRMDASGGVSLHGDPVPLASRPVHLSTDRESRFALIAYPAPSRIGVHAIAADGTLGPEIPQAPFPPLPKTAHQVLVTPDGRRAVLPVRGNHAEEGKPEDPGSLEIFDYRDGRLTHRETIAPNGGIGFGPRHVDFHPGKPWMYMSIERENEIAMFELGDTTQGPKYRTSTLERPDDEKPRQLGGAIHVHPGGRFVYVSNRADGTVDFGGRKVFNGGENSIAVFAIDAATGKPTRIQGADPRGMHVRTFHIDPTGRLLVAGCMTSRDVREGDAVRNVPGGLSVFRIGDDGRLAFVRKYDADVRRDHLFWCGMVAV